MRVWPLLLVTLLAANVARADRAADLAAVHLEVVGGKERLAALGTFRATGNVVMAGKRVRFTMVAARPNRFRLDTEAGGRSLVQGYDGFAPPWQLDTGVWPPRYLSMEPGNARRFIADAEFDDPLVGGPARGFTVEFGGEVETDGKKFLRLLLTHQLTETFALLIDPQTYLIEYRVEVHNNTLGRKQQVVTHYDQYQPVEGVLLPFKVTTTIDGAPSQVMEIERIEPNPPTTAETFSRPMVQSAPEKKK